MATRGVRHLALQVSWSAPLPRGASFPSSSICRIRCARPTSCRHK